MIRHSDFALALIASILLSFQGTVRVVGWVIVDRSTTTFLQSGTNAQGPPFISSRLVPCQLQAASSSSSSSPSSIPTGRVEDIDQWIQWCSDSLEKFRGISLLEYMHVQSIQQVHTNERYAVVSHGTQKDPIFCYANAATLRTFQYDTDTETESEFYQLPSRKSAPTAGGERQKRQAIMDDALRIDENSSSSSNNNPQVWDIKTGIRQRKDGSLFEFRNVLLWNVYKDDAATTTTTAAKRVGQCAVYDTAQIKEVYYTPSSLSDD